MQFLSSLPSLKLCWRSWVTGWSILHYWKPLFVLFNLTLFIMHIFSTLAYWSATSVNTNCGCCLQTWSPIHFSPVRFWFVISKQTRGEIAKFSDHYYLPHNCFGAGETAGAALVGLAMACAAVWHRGLALGLLRVLPGGHVAHFVVGLVSGRGFVLKTSDGQQSRLRRLKNSTPQGSVLAPLLFNIYIHGRPPWCRLREVWLCRWLGRPGSPPGWRRIKSALSQDMSTLALYLRQWRLKLSEGWTVSTVFHLNNREAKLKLGVHIDTRLLNFQPTTTYLGVKLDRTLSCRQHLAGLRDRIMAHITVHSSANLWVQDGEWDCQHSALLP